MRVARPVGIALSRLWADFERIGPELPAGPLVLAANHYSHVDPVVVSFGAGRPVRFLAVDELFGRSTIFDRLTLWLGAIPMSRTKAPLGALRVALAELAAGGTVGLFPEGLRVWAWGEVEPKRGAAWLARRAGVPLVPMAIVGTDLVLGRGVRRLSRNPVTVVACEPIQPGDYPPGGDPAGAMTREWEKRIDGALRSAAELRNSGG
ncbi:MAG: lysophospholipid acyltransferase family protein [Acidimicrobiia bacterium]